jgi:hypothetical protein
LVARGQKPRANPRKNEDIMDEEEERAKNKGVGRRGIPS